MWPPVETAAAIMSTTMAWCAPGDERFQARMTELMPTVRQDGEAVRSPRSPTNEELRESSYYVSASAHEGFGVR